MGDGMAIRRILRVAVQLALLWSMMIAGVARADALRKVIIDDDGFGLMQLMLLNARCG